MKFEISDILNDECEFDLIKLRIHGKIKHNIASVLFLKHSINSYKFIHIIFIIISSMGLLILSNEFIHNDNQKFLGTYLRELTFYSLAKKLKISHSTYLIISAIIFIICACRLIFLLNFKVQINNKDPFGNFKSKRNLIVRILNHIVYVFFSYLIEFLSFIFYIEIFPKDFIIKKDSKINGSLQIIFLLLNGLLIITYNMNNYFFLRLINRPLSQQNYPIKYKFTVSKLIIFQIFQNFSLIHPLHCYFSEEVNNIWSTVYFIIIGILLISLYFIEINTYWLNNVINSTISIIGEFCFVSIIIETIIYALNIKYSSIRELLFFVFVKLLFSLCLYFGLNKIYDKIMIKVIKKKIFNNPYNNQFDNELNDSILYIREKYENKNKKFLSKINKLFIEHKKNCTNNNCACKLIVLNKIKGSREIFSFDELVKKLNYFIESILIHYNYQNDYYLSLLLSEHFLIYKENPYMSYSILQTLFHSNFENLTFHQLIVLYECMTKYINSYIKTKTKKINIEKQNGSKLKLSEINREEELSHYFHLILKLKKAIKFMIKYSTEFLSILKHKDNYESSSMVKLDEIFNDIKCIISPYLTTHTLNQLLHFLSLENTYTLSLERHLSKLEEHNRNLTYEFLYKIFLFADFFWKGKIPEKLNNIFFVFNREHLIYNTDIDQQIYSILETKYNEYINNPESKYYILLKFTKGIKITYISEMLSKILLYKQNELINHDFGILLLRELIIPHEYLAKKIFILQPKSIIKDKWVYIFDKNGYMYDLKLNITFQIGLYKNILYLCALEIDKNKNIMKFYANRNLKILSINKNFEEKLSISLALIREFNIEIKDIFGINMDDINTNYQKDIKKIRSMREFKILDTKEYILKNLFRKKGTIYNYHIVNKYIVDDKEEDFIDIDNENEKILKEKKNNDKNQKKIEKKLDNLFEGITFDTFKFTPIYYIINNKNFKYNLKLVFDKINTYEQDKLESKNIFNDFMQLTTNVNENIVNSNFFLNLRIQPRLIYDTVFFLCKIEIYSQSKLVEIRKDYSGKEQFDEESERHFSNDNLIFNQSSKKVITKMEDLTVSPTIFLPNDDDIINMRKKADYNSNYFRKKIINVKTPKYKLFAVLTLVILILLIMCIYTFNYQKRLVFMFDNIFDAIYYNYYQRGQFTAINTMILSMFYKITNISSKSDINENKKVLEFLGKNIENGRILFINSFMQLQVAIHENFTKLYEPFISNKITVNWENRIFLNDYITKTALTLAEIHDVSQSDINETDKIDCENFLLERYKGIDFDQKKTKVYGNFIKLLYYFVINYETGLFNYFKNMENTFYDSLDKFSKYTKLNNVGLEIIIMLFFLVFFFINLYFLIQNNKYLFKNILYMFIDFTQDKTYNFNNKIINLLLEKKISNYIALLKEFTPKNLDNLKYDKNINYVYKEKEHNISNLSIINEEDKTKDTNQESKTNSKVDGLAKVKKIKNATTKIPSKKNVQNSDKKSAFKITPNNKSSKNVFMVNNEIRALNNKDLNNITNNSVTINNSRNNSTNILLDSTMNSINNNNSLISGSVKHTYSLKSKLNKEKNKEDDNSKNLSMYIDELEIKKDEDYGLTIDTIFEKTEISMLKSIKIMIIIFIIFTLIFIIYSIYKILTLVLFVYKFNNVIRDFSAMILQFNEVIHYWNNIQTLFILPNSTNLSQFEETENYFYQINKNVSYIINNRIDNYKRVKRLYNILSDQSTDLNSTGIDFCLGHSKCQQVFYTDELLTKDIESTVNLYAKEIENYYKDFYPNKNKIQNKKDIISLFINDKYELLSLNINHVFIYIEQIFLEFFMKDEKDIIDKFNLEITVLDTIEVCFCALLNLFSALFVYSYINRIIGSVEISSIRINDSIMRIKMKCM